MGSVRNSRWGKRPPHPCYRHKNWRKLRQAKLSISPVCEICLRRGRAVPAVHVDHKVSLAHGGPWFPPLDELTALCVRCHQLKTARVDNGRDGVPVTRTAFAGSDAHGNPLDPDDPWNC